MHRNKVSTTRLLLLLLIIASLPSACSREEPTSDIDPTQPALMDQSAGLEPTQMTSSLPATPSLPDLTPPSVQAPEWGEIFVETVCFSEENTYREMDGPPEYFNMGSSAKTILGGMGLSITDQNGPCEATLTLRFTAEALSASYLPGGLCYTGAILKGSITLSAPGHEDIAKTINNRKEPPMTINIPSGGSCNKYPERAPFGGLWQGELLDSLAYIWGPRVYVEALDIESTSSTATILLGGTRPDDDLINALIHMLPKQTRAVMDILESMGDAAQPAIPYIKLILLDETEHLAVRKYAADVLSRMDALTPEGIPTLLEIMRTMDFDFDARREAAILLGRMKPVNKALVALRHTLAISDEELRMLSLYGLGEAGAEAVPYIIQALNDESENVRTTASVVLGYMGVEAVPPILQAMQSAEEKGRVAATEALKNLSGHDFGMDLIQWQDWWDEMTALMASITTDQGIISSLDSEEMIIRWYAIDKVTQMGPQFSDAVPELIYILENEPELAYPAAEALIAIGSEAVPALIQTIPSEDAAAHYLSIYALGEIGPSAIEAVPAMIADMARSFWDNEPTVSALNKITGQGYGEDADAWAAWWETQ